MNEMNCNECLSLLDAYLDNELDAATAIHLSRHINGCDACRSHLADMQALRASVRKLPYHAAPEMLRKNILAQLHAQASPQQNSATSWRIWFAPAFSVAALAAAFLLYINVPLSGDPLADELVASHVRSLQERHLNDVASSDRHTVKPWFTGKLDYAPPVYDFSSQGYPLLGGRLDYLANHAVAALSYGRNKHIINLFVMPSAKDDSSMETISRRGYNIVSWRQNHMQFEAVSDLNSKELQMLGDLILGQPK